MMFAKGDTTSILTSTHPNQAKLCPWSVLSNSPCSRAQQQLRSSLIHVLFCCFPPHREPCNTFCTSPASLQSFQHLAINSISFATTPLIYTVILLAMQCISRQSPLHSRESLLSIANYHSNPCIHNHKAGGVLYQK